MHLQLPGQTRTTACFLTPLPLRYMSAGGEDDTTLVPQWPSATWWPLLVETTESSRVSLTSSMTIQPLKGDFFVWGLRLHAFLHLAPRPSQSWIFVFAFATGTSVESSPKGVSASLLEAVSDRR